MRQISAIYSVLAVCITVSTGALAQFPRDFLLPTDDFVWTWGTPPALDDSDEPDFTTEGIDLVFQCKLTGSFRRRSRLRGYETLRSFERSLRFSPYFVTDATIRLNRLFVIEELQWAILDCAISEDLRQALAARERERLELAIERAERRRDRRRRSMLEVDE